MTAPSDQVARAGRAGDWPRPAEQRPHDGTQRTPLIDFIRRATPSLCARLRAADWRTTLSLRGRQPAFSSRVRRRVGKALFRCGESEPVVTRVSRAAETFFSSAPVIGHAGSFHRTPRVGRVRNGLTGDGLGAGRSVAGAVQLVCIA